jgi:hypothetical protein
MIGDKEILGKVCKASKEQVAKEIRIVYRGELGHGLRTVRP